MRTAARPGDLAASEWLLAELPTPDPRGVSLSLRREIGTAGVRWVTTVLAALSVLAAVLLATGVMPARASFPIRMSGSAVMWAAGLACVLWGLLAGASWQAWWRDRDKPGDEHAVDRDSGA